jgi:RHH-type rel operon transcriptional repressor/antitoxin RelB
MLGLRLDAETEAGLARAARRERRSKSEIARDALRAYLRRTDQDAELIAAVKRISALTGEEDLRWLDENQADLESLLNEEEAAFRTGRAA